MIINVLDKSFHFAKCIVDLEKIYHKFYDDSSCKNKNKAKFSTTYRLDKVYF